MLRGYEFCSILSRNELKKPHPSLHVAKTDGFSSNCPRTVLPLQTEVRMSLRALPFWNLSPVAGLRGFQRGDVLHAHDCRAICFTCEEARDKEAL